MVDPELKAGSKLKARARPMVQLRVGLRWMAGRSICRAHRCFLAERFERQYTVRHFFDPSVPTHTLIDPHLRVP